jgi:membrane fusion protein, copper/silver efflux system
MRRRLIIFGVAGAAILIVGGYGLYELGIERGIRLGGQPVSRGIADDAASLKAGDIDPATGKRVLYWHDPMVPGQRFERPGKSPFMDMMLVPVYAGAGGGGDGGVAVSPRTRQSFGVRTVEVRRELLTPRIEATGNVAYNERDQVVVEARAAAFVERLHVRATFDRVSAGQPLVELYVPDWVAGQEELLSLRRLRGDDDEALIEAARRRLRQAGMTDAQIRVVEARGTVEERVTLEAPIDGVVVDLAIREGMAVMAGETLYRINGLDRVWIEAAVPEGQAGLLRPDAVVEARVAALPGRVFEGRLQAILPGVDVRTRTQRARFELENADGRLAPGMFVSVAVESEAVERLSVPTEAVIRTGRRTVVVAVDDAGAFRPVDVEIGIEANERTEITSGLEAGRTIVASGQFLIDSEASLTAAGRRMGDAPPPTEIEPR